MRIRLLRAAITLYPRRWRRRYGSELEQLVVDAEAGVSTSVLGSFLVIAGVAAAGLGERFRETSTRARIAVGATGAVVAALLVNAVAIANDPSTGVTLAPNVTLGPNVQVVNAPASNQGTLPPAGTGHVIVTLDPQTGEVVSVSGAPAYVVLNPDTGMVVSVRQNSPSAG